MAVQAVDRTLVLHSHGGNQKVGQGNSDTLSKQGTREIACLHPNVPRDFKVRQREEGICQVSPISRRPAALEELG